MGKIYSRKSFNCQRTFKNLGKLWYMRRVLSIETEIASLHKSFSSSDVTNDQYPYRCHHLFFLNQASHREVVTFLVMHNVFNLQLGHRHYCQHRRLTLHRQNSLRRHHRHHYHQHHYHYHHYHDFFCNTDKFNFFAGFLVHIAEYHI